MEQVQYGSYPFPHNPRLIQVKGERKSTVYTLPFLGQMAEEGVQGAREITLEGELFSQTAGGAMALYLALNGAYEKGGEDYLFLPGHRPFLALFTGLELQAMGDGKVLWYRARFVQSKSWEGRK